MSIVKKKSMAVVVAILVVIEISTLFLMHKSISSRELDIVSLKNSDKSNEMFAIMLEQTDGTYKELEDTAWPSEDEEFRYNSEKSGCIDSNGNELTDVLTFDNINNKVSLKTQGQSYCYLYFDIFEWDVKVTVKTDDTYGELPSTSGYKGELSCTNSTATFNDKYQRIEIDSLTSEKAKCNLTYTQADTSGYTKLIDEVESKVPDNTNGHGYRYTGKEPDNWIWFNNELWRIIGSIPTCTNSTCSTSENMVKIIRNDSIGGLIFNTTAGRPWGRNTLYGLLNAYYLQQKDGTNSGYCFSYQNQVIVDCNYSDVGISEYYRKMIPYVFWRIGAVTPSYTAAAAYSYESNTRYGGQVGLMNASDYGYAVDSSYYSTVLSGYNATAITATNWLYGQSYEWTINYYSSSVVMINYTGGLITSSPIYGATVRPAVHLNPDVYIIDGTGTAADPYIIGM